MHLSLDPSMRIYFAAPLFSAAERQFNAQLTQRLEAYGFTVFLPQRDGVEKNKPPYNSMDPEQRRQALFQLDKEQIFAAAIFLFVLDGRVPDEGACVELGIAYCQRELQGAKKLLLGLQTDSRAAFLGAKLNPMLRIPLDEVVSDEEALLQVLHSLSKASGAISYGAPVSAKGGGRGSVASKHRARRYTIKKDDIVS